MKKWILLIVGFMLLMAILIGVSMFTQNNNKVIYSNRAITDIEIDELIEDDWFDYSYFWQMGKDENGNDLTLVTIYWTKVNEEGISKYVTDGKKWEAVE